MLLKKYDDVVAAVEERARAYVMAGVKPVFVFDGRRLPGKTCTDQARAERRLAAQALIDAELDGTIAHAAIKAFHSRLRKSASAAPPAGAAVVT